jgi:hypothetical protein
MKKKIIAMRIEDEEQKMIEVLRKKHFINISELFRNTIRNVFERMEKSNK